MLAQGRGDSPEWCVSEQICHAGPQDRPFEERHGYVTIAAVVAGSFQYRTDSGGALLHPGSFVLGNHGSGFECGHAHTAGDRCIAIQLRPDAFAEIAAIATGSARFTFSTPMLPLLPRCLPQVAALEAMAESGDALRIEQAVPRLFEAVLGVLSGARPSAPALSALDERRVSRALRHIEEHADHALDLESMARAAATSKYHFLRIFTRSVGTTPYQWLLGLRLRRAAVRLATTPLPVSAVAFQSGFGDLSTFNQRFRRMFASTPSAYRRRFGGRG